MSNWDCSRLVATLLALILSSLISSPLRAEAAQSTATSLSGQANQSTANSPSSPPPGSIYEDHESLSLERSHLLMLPPMVLEKTDLPTSPFIREHIRLTWRPLDSVDLYIAIPRGVSKPPVILYLYSYPETTGRFQNDSWTLNAISRGYASVGFVSFLTADRIPTSRLASEWFISDLQESLVTTVHDVQMILNYLASRGDLDMDRVGMFGVGSGGTIGILASAVDPRIKAIEVFNPWGDWQNWLAKSTAVPKERRVNFLTPKFLENVAPLDPIQMLPKVKAQNVCIQNVRSDSSVPVESQEKIEARAPDVVEILQFGDYDALISVETAAGVFDWLKQALQPEKEYKVETDKSKHVHFYPAIGKKFDAVSARP
jgi:dienelactone hydrolase